MIVLIDTHDGKHYETRVVGNRPVTLGRLLENISAYGSVNVNTIEGGSIQVPLSAIKRIGFSTDEQDGIRQ